MSTAYPAQDVFPQLSDTGNATSSAGRTATALRPLASRYPAISQLSLSGVFAGSQGRTLTNLLVTLAACGLWLITLMTEVGGEYEAFAKRQILGIVTVHIAISLAVLLLYLVVDGAYLGRLLTRNTFVIGAIGVVYVS